MTNRVVESDDEYVSVSGRDSTVDRFNTSLNDNVSDAVTLTALCGNVAVSEKLAVYDTGRDSTVERVQASLNASVIGRVLDNTTDRVMASLKETDCDRERMIPMDLDVDSDNVNDTDKARAAVTDRTMLSVKDAESITDRATVIADRDGESLNDSVSDMARFLPMDRVQASPNDRVSVSVLGTINRLRDAESVLEKVSDTDLVKAIVCRDGASLNDKESELGRNAVDNLDVESLNDKLSVVDRAASATLTVAVSENVRVSTATLSGRPMRQLIGGDTVDGATGLSTMCLVASSPEPPYTVDDRMGLCYIADRVGIQRAARRSSGVPQHDAAAGRYHQTFRPCPDHANADSRGKTDTAQESRRRSGSRTPSQSGLTLSGDGRVGRVFGEEIYRGRGCHADGCWTAQTDIRCSGSIEEEPQFHDVGAAGGVAANFPNRRSTGGSRREYSERHDGHGRLPPMLEVDCPLNCQCIATGIDRTRAAEQAFQYQCAAARCIEQPNLGNGFRG